MTAAAGHADAAPAEADNGRHFGATGVALLALGVGILTGFGAAGLRALMSLFHNLFFLGELSLTYAAEAFDPVSPWGPWVILAPVIGGLAVVWLVQRFAPEARGTGVAEVMDAVYYRHGRIRPVVVLVKSLASALSIGSGASVGREGPIIQIGSGIGSSVGQFLKLTSWQTITLVAAGAGAGIAATFNTPLGAVMFAVELILPEVSSRTFLPVVLATGAATLVGWVFFGVAPAFLVPLAEASHPPAATSITLLPMYVALGFLCGLAATAFIRLLEHMEHTFPRLSDNPYIQNFVGMLGVGVLIYTLYVLAGEYYVSGVGYATIQGFFTGEVSGIGLLLVLFVAKLVATTVSLGAGASGGIFSPSLFLGVTLGGAFGGGVALLWPGLVANPMEFGVLGMAGVVGGATGAAMTAILMIFEMTQDYNAIVPAIVTVACAIGLRRALCEENIYTARLARRGHHIPKSRHTNLFFIRHAREFQHRIAGVVTAEEAEQGRIPKPEYREGYFLVTRGRRIAGLLPATVSYAEGTPARPIRDFVVVRDDDFVRDVIRRIQRRNRHYALIVHGGGVPRADNVTGVITRTELGTAFLDQWAD